MPAHHRIEPSLECVFVTLTGVVTDQDLFKGQQEMYSDSLFEGRYPHLIDATEVTKLQVTAKAVRSVAKYAVDRGVRKVALVANSDFVYGMMRMYEGYAFEAECYVYRDMKEALAQLLQTNYGINGISEPS